jgi:hypothetical protein
MAKTLLVAQEYEKKGEKGKKGKRKKVFEFEKWKTLKMKFLNI